MIAVNTNEASLMARNYSRLNDLNARERVERLSNGYRLNRGADDPSGMGISSSMKAHVRGLSAATENVQDTIKLLNTVDAYMNNMQDILTHMRDLSVRLANEAPLNAGKGGDPLNPQPAGESPAYELYAEINRFMEHIDNSFKTEVIPGNPPKIIAPLLSYNGKNLFESLGASAGSQRGFAGNGQVSQVGPDNDTSHQVQIILDDLATITNGFELPFAPPNPADANSMSWYAGFAQDKIDLLTTKIDMLSSTRAKVGTMVVRLQHTVEDLSADYINSSAAKSRITDANMAEEIVAMTKNQILRESATVAEGQANAVPLITLGLLNAIYDGMSARGIGGNSQAA